MQFWQHKTRGARMSQTGKIKSFIGAIDKIDFPEIGLENIPAKIDTGAKSSSIHASYISEVQRGDKKRLRFCLLGNRKLCYEVDEYSARKIKSSNGIVQTRFVVKLSVALFDKKIKTDFTLAQRKEMRFPVLLGRRLLRNRFLVDVSHKDLAYQYKIANKTS